MTVATLDPRTAAELIASGALLVDIRDADEHARERIASARNMPLSALGPIDTTAPLIFHCRSGQRTRLNASRLSEASGGLAYLLDGGIDAWKAAGLPTVVDGKQPLDIMRQVQIIGGALVILSIVFGWLVSPFFLALGAGVGAGMVHAGITGSCAMTRLLAPLPWNRSAAA